jgi:hypothetical protein
MKVVCLQQPTKHLVLATVNQSISQSFGLPQPLALLELLGFQVAIAFIADHGLCFGVQF